jgi:hypothetical protein
MFQHASGVRRAFIYPNTLFPVRAFSATRIARSIPSPCNPLYYLAGMRVSRHLTNRPAVPAS